MSLTAHPLFLFWIVVLLLFTGSAIAADHQVHPGESIQDAVTDAQDGDTVTVHSGSYSENIVIRSQIDLMAHGSVTLTPANMEDNVLAIRADRVRISGFTISGSNKSGVYAAYSNDSRIDNNTIKNNRWGIQSHISDRMRMNRNTITNSTEGGIRAYVSDNISVFANDVSGSGGDAGIFLYQCMDAIIHDNLIHDNDGRWGGVTLYASERTIMINNIAHDNLPHDLHLRYADDNLMSDNIFLNGAHSWSCVSNAWFVQRTAGPNIVDGPRTRGNYWGDYLGNDSNRDGIGDTPHVIPGCPDRDMYPLTCPDCGDCNYDGAVTASDVIEAYRLAVDPTYPMDYGWVADLDSNNYISANDVVELYHRAVDPTYPVTCDILRGRTI